MTAKKKAAEPNHGDQPEILLEAEWEDQIARAFEEARHVPWLLTADRLESLAACIRGGYAAPTPEEPEDGNS